MLTLLKLMDDGAAPSPQGAPPRAPPYFLGPNDLPGGGWLGHLNEPQRVALEALRRELSAVPSPLPKGSEPNQRDADGEDEAPIDTLVRLLSLGGGPADDDAAASAAGLDETAKPAAAVEPAAAAAAATRRHRRRLRQRETWCVSVRRTLIVHA